VTDPLATLAALVADVAALTVRVEALEREPRPESRRWLTVREAAERLGCSPDAVRMRINRGRPQAKRHGRTVYVSAESVDQLG
jgi:excisionase family DNA binding protein